MIIYYHCTRDSALLLSFLLYNLSSLHPISFHEMIFILVPPVFLELCNARCFVVRARNSATKNVITGSTADVASGHQARTNNAAIAHAQTN